jgi:hypothetical protein
VPHGEVQQRPPREIRVLPRAVGVHQLPRRPHHLVHLRAEEEGQRAARHAAVDDGAVEAAPVAAVGERHEGVSDVDDEGAGVGADGEPAAGGEDLQAADVVLVEDGERGGVAMRAGAERLVGTLAGRVVVEAHDGVVPLEESPEVGAPHAEARPQHLHDLQRQPAHLRAVAPVHLAVVPVLLAQLLHEVVGDAAVRRRRRRRVVAERQGLLPGQLGGEAAREAAGVAAALALAPLRALLLVQGQREEGVHAAVGLRQQRLVDAVADHLEEAVQLAGLAHLPDHLGVGGAAGQVDERHGQLLGGVRGGALVGRPEELLRDVGLAAQAGGVEDESRRLLMMRSLNHASCCFLISLGRRRKGSGVSLGIPRIVFSSSCSALSSLSLSPQLAACLPFYTRGRGTLPCPALPFHNAAATRPLVGLEGMSLAGPFF